MARIPMQMTAWRHFLRRFATPSLIATAVVAGPSPAAASVTIGQLAPVDSPAVCGSATDRFHETVPAGSSYVVPATGTITSWSHNAAAGPNQQLTMKVFRKVADPLTYSVLARDVRPLAPSTTNTFLVNFPVKPGDILGSNGFSTGLTACFVNTSVVFARLSRDGDLLEGQSGDFEPVSCCNQLNISAVFSPANTFTLGRTSRNRKKGTATLTATVPNPGELAGSGKGVKVASAAGAVTSKTVSAPGEVKLTIRAKGKKKRTLNETGKVKVKPKITYTPTGGDPSTQSTKLKLKKR